MSANPRIFVNRILNLKKIKYIGLDMDHTLIRYHSKRFEALVYDLVIENLTEKKHYPSLIRDLPFNFDDVIRGLVIDSKNGNILKLNRFGAIKMSYHGTRMISFSEQKQFYRSIYVDLNDPNYMAIDTSFSIAFCALYSQLIDIKDQQPESLPSYSLIAQDVIKAVDEVHAQGILKQHIRAHLEDYVIRDKTLVEGLKLYLQYGKKLFILTNSDYQYTKALLDYAITPYLEPGQKWQDLFEFVITLANKPRFFYDNFRFLSVDPIDGSLHNYSGKISPGIYQGGHARQFTEDLHLKGDEILYIGDHIYGDILRLKKDCNWRTALVLEEIGAEIDAQQKAHPLEEKIAARMKVKNRLEDQSILLQSRAFEENSQAFDEEIQTVQAELMELDKEIATLIQKQQSYFNPKWDRVFRAGAEESFLAYQIERYACIYMEKLADLFSLSPLSYFRPHRRTLAHDEYA